MKGNIKLKLQALLTVSYIFSEVVKLYIHETNNVFYDSETRNLSFLQVAADLKILGIKIEGLEEKVSREEIKSLIELGEEQGALNETERNMIDGIIQFDDIL